MLTLNKIYGDDKQWLLLVISILHNQLQDDILT